jgi:hypothetical protein
VYLFVGLRSNFDDAEYDINERKKKRKNFKQNKKNPFFQNIEPQVHITAFQRPPIYPLSYYKEFNSLFDQPLILNGNIEKNKCVYWFLMRDLTQLESYSFLRTFEHTHLRFRSFKQKYTSLCCLFEDNNNDAEKKNALNNKTLKFPLKNVNSDKLHFSWNHYPNFPCFPQEKSVDNDDFLSSSPVRFSSSPSNSSQSVVSSQNIENSSHVPNVFSHVDGSKSRLDSSSCFSHSSLLKKRFCFSVPLHFLYIGNHRFYAASCVVEDDVEEGILEGCEGDGKMRCNDVSNDSNKNNNNNNNNNNSNNSSNNNNNNNNNNSMGGECTPHCVFVPLLTYVFHCLTDDPQAAYDDFKKIPMVRALEKTGAFSFEKVDEKSVGCYEVNKMEKKHVTIKGVVRFRKLISFFENNVLMLLTLYRNSSASVYSEPLSYVDSVKSLPIFVHFDQICERTVIAVCLKPDEKVSCGGSALSPSSSSSLPIKDMDNDVFSSLSGSSSSPSLSSSSSPSSPSSSSLSTKDRDDDIFSSLSNWVIFSFQSALPSPSSGIVLNNNNNEVLIKKLLWLIIIICNKFVIFFFFLIIFRVLFKKALNKHRRRRFPLKEYHISFHFVYWFFSSQLQFMLFVLLYILTRLCLRYGWIICCIEGMPCTMLMGWSHPLNNWGYLKMKRKI